MTIFDVIVFPSPTLPLCVSSRVCECVVPSLLSLLVDVGQYVSSTAGPLAHHHRDWRALLKVLQHSQDDVGTTLKDQGHDRDTLTDPFKEEESALSLCSITPFGSRVIHILQLHPRDSLWGVKKIIVSLSLSHMFHLSKTNWLYNGDSREFGPF